MAEKKYKLHFRLMDGTEQSVEFIVPDGEPGYTPVRGVDYFTEADIEETAIRAAELVEINSIKADLKTDETLCFDEAGVLGVNTTNDAEADNTLPITSAGVHTQIGNIEILLGTI